MDSNSTVAAIFMRQITGQEFAAMYLEGKVADRAPDGYIWICPDCEKESPTISGLTCHHKADLYEKD